MSSEHNTSNIVNIAQQAKDGEMPSNQQIKSELDPLVQHLENKEKQSVGLQKAEVLHNTRKLVETVEDTLESKNAGDKLQRIAAAAQRVAQRTSVDTSPNAVKVWNETREFVEILKDMVTNLVRSREFRKIVMDFLSIIKDVIRIEDERIGATSEAKEGFVEGKSTEAAQNIADKAQSVIKNLPDEMPEEQKRRFRENLRTLLTQLRDQSDLCHTFSKFLRLTSLAQREIELRVEGATIDKDVQEVEDLSVELIDSFIQGRSVRTLIQKLRLALEKIRNDQEIQTFLSDCREYIERAIQQPELINSDSYLDEGDALYRRGRQLSRKYQNDRTINNCVDEAQELMTLIKNDAQLNELQYRAGKVADSLTYTDIKGQSHIDFDLVGEMRKEIVPFLIERIKEVPMPGFRLENEDFEYLEVKDLFVTLEDILPDNISIKARNDTNLTLKNMENPVKSESVVKFAMEGLRPKFKDFYFTFKKKGLVKMSDEGRANLKIKGKGVSVYIDFDLDVDSNNKTILGKHKVEIKTDRIDVDILEADHKFLLNVATTLFAPQIKKGLEAALRNRFDELGTDWAAYLNKRIMYSLPSMQQIGSTMTKAAMSPISMLGETTVKTTVNP